MTGDLWRALADPTRRDLLASLRDGPRTTGGLAEQFPTSRYAVMKHLQVLVDAELVTVERRGRQRLNHLNAVPLRKAYQRLMAPYADATAAGLLRLAAAAESTTTRPTTPRGSAAMPDTTLLSGSIDIRQEVTIDAPRTAVFGALLEVGEWWPHRSDPGHDVMLEPAIGGHFAEAWDSGGELFGTVVEMEENTLLAIAGAMGLPEPTVGYFAYRLAEAADGRGTTLTVTHRAFGSFSAEVAAEYDAGWTRVTDALRNHISTRADQK